jgi:hypothetical protein
MNAFDEATYGPVLTLTFLFSPERPFISGNHLHGHNRHTGMRFLTREARAQKERLAREAFLAARKAKWIMPDYCYVEIVGMNIDADGDNLSKPLCDIMERSLYQTDRRIKDRRIISMKDKGPARVIVAIQAVNGKAFGYPKPGKKKQGEHVPFRSARGSSGKI